MTEFKLKSLHDKAVEINKVLIQEHKYENLVPHLDYTKVSFVSGYMSIEEYRKVCRKYTVATNEDKRWPVAFRYA